MYENKTDHVTVTTSLWGNLSCINWHSPRSICIPNLKWQLHTVQR